MVIKVVGTQLGNTIQKSVEDQVASALSRRDEKSTLCLAITEVTLVWMGEK